MKRRMRVTSAGLILVAWACLAGLSGQVWALDTVERSGSGMVNWTCGDDSFHLWLGIRIFTSSIHRSYITQRLKLPLDAFSQLRISCARNLAQNG